MGNVKVNRALRRKVANEKLRPTFRYRTQSFTVIDKPIPLADGSFGTFRREITVTADGDSGLPAQPGGTLYFRAIADENISSGDNDWWTTSGDVRVRVSGGEPILREVSGNMELLVPMKFGATLTQEIVW